MILSDEWTIRSPFIKTKLSGLITAHCLYTHSLSPKQKFSLPLSDQVNKVTKPPGEVY